MSEQTDEIKIEINGIPSGLKVTGLSELAGLKHREIDIMSYNKKRVYSNQTAECAETWVELLSLDSIDETEVLLTVAPLRLQSINHQIANVHALEESLDLIVNPLIKPIFKYCEENYHIVTRVTTSNEELIWKNEHILGLLTAAYIYRFISPIILSVFSENEKLGDCTECIAEYFLKVMKEISKTCYDRPVKIENKLHRLVAARVSATEYSDSLIWSYLSNVGLSESQQTHAIYSRVITDIIPKLELSQNVLTFLYVVLKRQLSFSFRSKLPKEYSSFNSLLDADSSSVFDKNGNHTEHDELLTSIQDYCIQDCVNRIKKSYHVDIGSDYPEYRPSEERNIVLFSLMSKYISDMEIISSLTRDNYSYVINIIREILKKYNLNELIKLIDSEVTGRAALTNAKEKALEKRMASIREEKRYENAVSQVRKIIGDRADVANPINRIFELAFKSDYMDPNTEEVVNINLDLLSQDLLIYIKLLL